MGKTVDSKGIEHCAKYGAVTSAPDHDRPIYCGGKSVKPREGIVGWKPITNLSKRSDGIQDIKQDGYAYCYAYGAKWGIRADTEIESQACQGREG